MTEKRGPAVVVSDLSVSFGDLVAVDDVSFEVEAGEVFGLLGPTVPGRRRRSVC